MGEHIDERRLDSDLRYRFEYLSKFLNFTSDDIAMLNTFAPSLSPFIPTICERVYRKLFSFDVTKRYFLIRNPPEKSNRTDRLCPIEMEIRRDMLTVYLKRVLTQREWNDTFLQYLSQIGRIHADRSSPNGINVDLIHINALLAYLELLFIEVLHEDQDFDPTTKRGILQAINKFFWIQNDFFSMHYRIEDKNERNERSKNRSKLCCWM